MILFEKKIGLINIFRLKKGLALNWSAELSLTKAGISNWNVQWISR